MNCARFILHSIGIEMQPLYMKVFVQIFVTCNLHENTIHHEF